MTKLRQIDKRWFLALALIYLFLLAIHLLTTPFGDDIWYGDKAHEMNLFRFISWYYLEWSGRVTSNALNFLFMGYGYDLWRFLNPIIFMLLAWAVVRISGAAMSIRNYIFVFALFFLFSAAILDYAVFWATGSIYYLWPATMAVFLLTPFIRLALRGETSIRLYPIYIVLAILSCMCNEQVTLCVLGCMVVTLLHYIIKNRRLPIRQGILFVLSILSSLVLFLSPGTKLRVVSETETFFPAFADMSTFGKIDFATPWFFTAFSIQLVLVVILLFAVCLWSFWKNPGKIPAWFKWPILCLLGLACAMAARGDESYYVAFTQPSLLAQQGMVKAFFFVLPYLFWGLLFVVLFLLLLRANLYYGLGFLMAVLSLVVLFFSPTIVASGMRTLFFAGIIFIVLILAQIKKPVHPALLVFTSCFALINIAGRIEGASFL